MRSSYTFDHLDEASQMGPIRSESDADERDNEALQMGVIHSTNMIVMRSRVMRALASDKFCYKLNKSWEFHIFMFRSLKAQAAWYHTSF